MVQYLSVVYDSRDKVGVFDRNVSHIQANAFHQIKMFLHSREN
jgi:hypothetical protein